MRYTEEANTIQTKAKIKSPALVCRLCGDGVSYGEVVYLTKFGYFCANCIEDSAVICAPDYPQYSPKVIRRPCTLHGIPAYEITNDTQKRDNRRTI